MYNITTVVTHNGIFHADEVFAIAVLRTVFESTMVTRTRDQNLINGADILVDIGGVYDINHNKFDHHQREGAGQRENGIPFSSCGLVWDRFGCNYLAQSKVPPEFILDVHNELDKSIIAAIDYIDCNGMKGFSNVDAPVYTISQVISSFNDPDGNQDEAFWKAVELAENILQNEIKGATKKVAAQSYLDEQIQSQKDNNVLILDKFVIGAGEQAAINGFIRYVYPDISGTWRCQITKDSPSLPESWGGLNNSDLDKVVGIEGCIFCHRGRFIAGHKTKEGAIALAKLSI